MEIARFAREHFICLGLQPSHVKKLCVFFLLLCATFLWRFVVVVLKVWDLRNQDQFDIPNKIAILKFILCATRFACTPEWNFDELEHVRDLTLVLGVLLAAARAHWVKAFSTSDLSFPNYTNGWLKKRKKSRERKREREREIWASELKWTLNASFVAAATTAKLLLYPRFTASRKQSNEHWQMY